MNPRDAKRKLAKLEIDLGEIKKLLSGGSKNDADSRRAAWRPRGPTAIALALGVFIVSAVILYAAPIPKPNTFTSGTVISSAQVNANFDALYGVSHPRTFMGAVFGSFPSSSVNYAMPGFIVGTEIFIPMPDAGTLRALRPDVTINSLSGPAVVRLRLNGAPTPVSVSVPPFGTGVFADLANNVSYNPGDRLSIEVDTLGAPLGALGEFGFSFHY